MLATQKNAAGETITALREKIDRLADEAPHIPHRIWAKRQEVLNEDSERLVGLLHNK